MFNFLLSNVQSMELGLLCLRVGIGLIFVMHGWGKIIDVQQWHWLGSQMSHLGITFLPAFWGFLAAAAEFVGGLCLVFGFATRIVSVILVFQMIIALLYHFNNGDGFKIYSHALSLLIVFVGLFLTGPGKMSLDYFLHSKEDVQNKL